MLGGVQLFSARDYLCATGVQLKANLAGEQRLAARKPCGARGPYTKLLLEWPSRAGPPPDRDLLAEGQAMMIRRAPRLSTNGNRSNFVKPLDHAWCHTVSHHNLETLENHGEVWRPRLLALPGGCYKRSVLAPGVSVGPSAISC